MRVAAGLLVLCVLGAIAAALFLPSGQTAPAVRAEGASGSSTQAQTTAEVQVSANDVEDGRLLYVQTCASCHGATGQGSNVAPALTNSGPAALDFYMRTGRMPLGKIGTPPEEQPPTLTSAQIAAIVAYASNFSQGPQIPSVTTGADLSRGWQLYVNNCAACHGASADGGSVGAGVNAPSLLDIDPVGIAEAMLIGPGPMPKFSFPQDDVNAIATYVESLRNPAAPGGFPLSGTGPVPEGILAALFGVGVLIVIVRWVARRDRLPPKDPEVQGPHGEEVAE